MLSNIFDEKFYKIHGYFLRFIIPQQKPPFIGKETENVYGYYSFQLTRCPKLTPVGYIPCHDISEYQL